MKPYSDNYEFCVGIEKIQPIGFEEICELKYSLRPSLPFNPLGYMVTYTTIMGRLIRHWENKLFCSIYTFIVNNGE